MFNNQNARDWDLSFGPVSGAAGTTTVITRSPQCLFRVEKVMATDTGTPPGFATRIMSFLVGQRLQRPTSSGSTLALFFGPAALGNGLRWDTCERGLSISITVSFVVAATFDMVVFGKGIA
ncbi:MAG: hypothetical protein UY96_C0003G0110 [Parcubacteria group bacterium GW2011_GWB1_56_8]|nr:MAG: hypothetical protein UY96_C0003G0110 [Parcubacteria group bacterium GW2011_GWB1_56_8]